MIVPANSTTAKLQALLDNKVDSSVGHDDISSFAKCWDDARCSGEALAVDNRRFCTKERGDCSLKSQMNVNRPVESRGSA